MEFCDIDMEMVEVSLGTPPSELVRQNVTMWYRLDQALVPRVRIHVARERDAREPAEGDGLCTGEGERGAGSSRFRKRAHVDVHS